MPRQETLRRAIYSLGTSDRLRRYERVFSLQPAGTIDSLFRPGLLPPNSGDRILECWSDLGPAIESADELNGFHLLELRSSLPDELLMYGDKLSMAHALEVRVPYLDREVVEYVQSLDSGLKVRNFSRKWLHRRVCREFLPAKIVQRKKRGFAVNVVDDWFDDSVRGRINDNLLDPGSLMYKFLRPEPVRQMLRAHSARQSDNHKVLFSLVVFEQWLRSSGFRS